MLCFGPSLKWFDNETISTNQTFLSVTLPSIVSSTSMLKNLQKYDQTHCIEFQFGFFMDNVEDVRNTSTYYEKFLLCPDPIIYPFNNNGQRVQYRYDYLTIEGANLLDIATINDYLITIGSYPCNITSISDQQIVCQPTNRTIEKLIRKKRSLLNMNTLDNEQAIVRVSIVR